MNVCPSRPRAIAGKIGGLSRLGYVGLWMTRVFRIGAYFPAISVAANKMGLDFIAGSNVVGGISTPIIFRGRQ